jgi:hypothetical protein
MRTVKFNMSLGCNCSLRLGGRSWHSKVAVCAFAERLLPGFHDVVFFNSSTHSSSLQLSRFLVTLRLPAKHFNLLPNQAR